MELNNSIGNNTTQSNCLKPIESNNNEINTGAAMPSGGLPFTYTECMGLINQCKPLLSHPDIKVRSAAAAKIVDLASWAISLAKLFFLESPLQLKDAANQLAETISIICEMEKKGEVDFSEFTFMFESPKGVMKDIENVISSSSKDEYDESLKKYKSKNNIDQFISKPNPGIIYQSQVDKFINSVTSSTNQRSNSNQPVSRNT